MLLIKSIFCNHQKRPPYRPAVRGRHLQMPLVAFFDADHVAESREGGAEGGTKTPVVEIAKVAFKGGIDEPFLVVFWEGADRGTGSANGLGSWRTCG